MCYEWSAAKVGRSSSFRAESEAVEDALVWTQSNADETDVVVILTDSLSVVKKVECGKLRETWEPIMERIRAKVTLCYIPGHCGLPWNERADTLAGGAYPIGELVRTPCDVIAEIKHRGKEREREREREREEQRTMWSVERLEEKGRKYGEGALVSARGRKKTVLNQHELGVITKNTLKHFLRQKGLCHNGWSHHFSGD